MKVKIGCHPFRATGTTAYLEAGGIEPPGSMIRTGAEITLDEVKGITS
jgi:hypothetical protein